MSLNALGTGDSHDSAIWKLIFNPESVGTGFKTTPWNLNGVSKSDWLVACRKKQRGRHYRSSQKNTSKQRCFHNTYPLRYCRQYTPYIHWTVEPLVLLVLGYHRPLL